ncbi:MAG: ABC transporter substrate-binding protein [Chloroflexota bacterium]
MPSIRMSRRSFLAGSTAAGTMALLAACAGQQTAPIPKAVEPASAAAPKPAAPEKQAAPASQGTITGTFWFNQPVQQDAFQKIIDRFHQSQSRVKMDVILVPQTEIGTKLATAIAGGEPPDAVRLGGPAINALFINNKHAAALDDFDSKISTYDWHPDVKRMVSRDGKMYAMPVNSGVQALIWNKDLYQKAGLDPEKPPTTLAQVLEYAAKVGASGEGRWGHYTTTAPTFQTGGDYFPAVLWSFGGKEISEDGKTVAFNSPEGVEALQWYKDLVDKKGVPAKQINETQMLTDYLTGSVGSMAAFPALLARVSEAPFKSGSAPFPAGPKGSIAPLGCGTIMVMAKSKNPTAGWEFARFIGLEPANMAFWNISFGQLPPRQSVRDHESWKEYEAKNPLVPAYLEGQKSARLFYYGPGSQEISTEMGKAVEAVVFGQKAPKQALDEAAKASQVILERELKKG